MEPLESSTESTLVQLCAIKIVTHIAFKCKGARRSRHKHGNDETGVLRSIYNLRVPKNLKHPLHTIVHPIVTSHRDWCENNLLRPKSVMPFFTWRGTLDIIKTAERVVKDEKQPLNVRFSLACNYFLESHIPRLLRRMQPKDFDTMKSRQRDFYSVLPHWTSQEVKDAAFENTDLIRALGEHRLLKMAKISVIQAHDSAFKYLEALPLEKARESICENVRVLPGYVFSPTSLRRLFAKLSQTQQEKHIGLFSHGLILTHMSWPYKSRFAEVAKSLVGNLSGSNYGSLLLNAGLYIKKRTPEDVRNLYFFWKLGMERRNGFFRDPSPLDQALIHLVTTALLNYRLIDQETLSNLQAPKDGNSENKSFPPIESIDAATKKYFNKFFNR